jgi:cytochrome c556
LFEAEETDPKSEAKASIWTNFDDFTYKADELKAIAMGLGNSIDSADDLVQAMSSLGSTCKSCHAEYRQ